MSVRKIILVDDDDDDTIFFKEALEEIQEIELYIVRNNEELMHLLNTESFPDIIFLSECKPVYSYECLNEIKENIKFKNIPVVVYSGSSNIDDIEKAYKAHANIFVTKPAAFTKIKEILVKILSLDFSKYMPQPNTENFVLK